jgi:signal transduction histidine kinase
MHPAPTSPHAPAAIKPSFPFASAVATFVTDDHWRIVACDLCGLEMLWGPPEAVRGADLRDVLAGLEPTWRSRLAATPAAQPTRLALPWQRPHAPAGLQVELRRLAWNGHHHFTALPAAPPPVQLATEGLAVLDGRPDMLAQLFLRNQMLETRLEHYLRHFPGVVYSQRGDGSLVFVGPGCEALTGEPAAALLRGGVTIESLVHEADRETFARESANHRARNTASSLHYRFVHRTTGEVRHVMDVRAPARAANGLPLGWEGVWLDVTRQYVAEDRLNEYGWKETLAVLTGGLLHDFGNLLSGIYSLSELYHSQLEPTHPMAEGLGLVKDQARQAQSLVRKIFSLNRATVGHRNYHSLNQLLREQVDLVRVILPRGIRLALSEPAEAIPVYVDEVAFRQTVVNLAINSRDALGPQGEIALTLEAPVDLAAFDRHHFACAPPRDRPLAAVRLRDSGCGIAPEKLPRIFDAFFTTKSAEQGSGLGLYNARLFAAAEGGALAVASSPGEGTEMVLFLPIADLASEGSAADSASNPGRAPAEPPHEAPAPPARRPAVLLHTPGLPPDSRLEQCLHESDWEVRNTVAEGELRCFLVERGASIDVLVICQSEEDAALHGLLDHVRNAHPHVRVAVQLIGQNPEAISAEVRRRVDLLLRPQRPWPETVAALARLVPAP